MLFRNFITGLVLLTATAAPAANPSQQADTTSHNILLFGDSMVGVLKFPMADYCGENGDSLHALTWNCATTEWYATTNTLEHFIEKYEPDYVVICLGGNEQFLRKQGLDKADGYIKTILQKIGDRPYYWIGSASWKKSTGIDSVIVSNVGAKRFFDSSQVDPERQKDGIHPTIAGARNWMECVMLAFTDPERNAHALRMNEPTREYKWTTSDTYGPYFRGFNPDGSEIRIKKAASKRRARRNARK